MAKRFLKYETESVNSMSPVDKYGAIKDDIKLSDFKNDLFYERDGIVKTIDPKYVPGMLVIEVSSQTIEDTSIGDKVKEAIQNGQPLCIYNVNEERYFYPICARPDIFVGGSYDEEFAIFKVFVDKLWGDIEPYTFYVSSVD